MPELAERLSALSSQGNYRLLKGIRRGLEKESLRVTVDGLLSQVPHPKSLGSTLTHPYITTDFSEALLEFITPPLASVPEVITQLEDIHRFTYQNINDELLWVNSMPCVLSRDEDIPLADYGSSNIGRMKKIYREGLGHRYGRLMQTIAGIHYNWSLPDDCWAVLQAHDQDTGSLQDYKTTRYFGLIRNFRRHFWLLLYLFGAAPAICRSFVGNRQHQLQPFGDDTHSLYTPYATSLRMGDLGYQSSAQESLIVCYNDLSTYIENLREALTKPYQQYANTGVQDTSGRYLQLNANLLQIENEFYSTIRPKRTTDSGETPLRALWQRGIEYVEVRCIDLNPYLPVGINADQMYFIEVFLLHCLLSESPLTEDQEYRNILENQRRMVYRGRDPALALLRGETETPLRAWATQLFEEMGSVANLLDMNSTTPIHGDAVNAQRPALHDADLTPAGRLLAEMRDSRKTYFQTALQHARQHRDHFLSAPLNEDRNQHFKALARQSLADQTAIENADDLSFEAFLARFYAQYHFDLSK